MWRMTTTDTQPDAVSRREPRAVNASIVRFLQYYLGHGRRLDYAVMISGPWGSGKTHLVREFLKTTKAKPLYVSLYGMTSTSQIEDEFYRQLHPVLSSPGMRIAGSVVKAFAKGALKLDFNGDDKDDGTLNVGLPELDLKKDLDDPRGRLLVFDDLERCAIPVGEVLGFINAYVEHDSLKAIIIANETKVMGKDDKYLEVREKLIGQTLEVLPEAAAAFETFLGLIEHGRARKFLADHRDDVLLLHSQGGRGNLRTLKHAMWDFEKIASQLREDHWDNAEAVGSLLGVVVATSMEHRAGALPEDELKRLIGQSLGRLMRVHGSGKRSRADEIDDSYPQVDFDKVVVPVEILAGMLFRGDIDGDAVRAAIDTSALFRKPGQQPLWMRAINLFEASDDEVDAVVAEVTAAFDRREVQERGQLMHLLGARLWYARLGLTEQTATQVEKDGLAYIAALEAAGEISSAGYDVTDRDESFHGYRVAESETKEFRTMAEAYRNASERARRATYLPTARELLGRFRDEPREVLLDMVVNDFRQALFHNNPILAEVPPEEFAAAVLALPPRQQTLLLELLHGRHERNPSTRMRPERDWAHQVEALLTAALPGQRPMSRERLRSAIARNLSVLRDGEDRETTD
jgi:hypothetical protein